MSRTDGKSVFLLLVLMWLCGAAWSQERESLPPDLGTRDFGHDWPTFLGPDRNGKSQEQDLRFNWSTARPPTVWQVPLGKSYGAPSISRGRLFHFDRFGDEDWLVCREAETGRELWKVVFPTKYDDMLGYNNGPRCTPVVDGAYVYTLSAEGMLRCARVVDGKRVWEVDTRERFHVIQNFFGVGSTPIVLDNFLIVNVGGSPPGGPPDVYAARGRVQGNGTGVVAFDKRTGEVRWQATDELASYASPVDAVILGRPWCFIFARGGLVGLDPRTGDVDFQYPWRAELLESVNASSPVVVGSEVFISATYGLGSSRLTVRPGGYDIVWKDQHRSREKSMMLYWNTPIYHDGYLYGSSGQHSGTAELRCIEWSTGEVAWSQPGMGRCSLLYADGHLVCLSEDGTLTLLKVNSQRYQQQQSVVLRDAAGRQLLTPDARTAPVLARGLLYVRGDDRLVCLDLAEQADERN